MAINGGYEWNMHGILYPSGNQNGGRVTPRNGGVKPSFRDGFDHQNTALLYVV
jgi:hypothetical protein